MKKSGGVKYAPVLNHALDELLNKDCDLNSFHGCDSWNKEGLVLKSNTEDHYNDVFPPVLDRRWNSKNQIDLNSCCSNNFEPLSHITGMNETITSGTYEKLKFLDLENITQGKLHFSILAKESAQFIFSQDDGFDGGLMLAIDGWGGIHRSNIRDCQSIPSDKASVSCGLRGKTLVVRYTLI